MRTAGCRLAMGCWRPRLGARQLASHRASPGLASPASPLPAAPAGAAPNRAHASAGPARPALALPAPTRPPPLAGRLRAAGSGVSPELKAAIDKYITENKVVVFIKGTKQFPQCGFSNTVVQVRARLGASCRAGAPISAARPGPQRALQGSTAQRNTLPAADPQHHGRAV